MPDSLIIDARHRLRWHQRLCSDAGTAMLWGAWLWLWRPLFSAFAWLSKLGAGAPPTLLPLAAGLPLGLERSAVALLGTSGTLLLWNLLPARRTPPPPPPSLQDYARHFDLSVEVLVAGRAAAVCVVHHDEQGRIVAIEARA